MPRSKRLLSYVLVTAAALTGARAASAAISVTDPTVAYTQNFNAFAGSTNAAVPFTNDSTIPGFYTYLSGSSTITAGPMDAIYRGTATVTNGTGSTRITSGATYPFYFLRPNSSTTDVQFRSFNTDTVTSGVGTGYLAYGFALTNNTATTVTGFKLDYTAFASASVLTNVETIAVSYAINANGVADADGTYTDAPGLNSTASADGTTLTQQTADVVSGLSIAPGQTLFIRFKDVNVGGTDRLIGIDNVSIQLPEPASLAAVGLIGPLALRRRRIDRR